jgi:hypothetical protein
MSKVLRTQQPHTHSNRDVHTISRTDKSYQRGLLHGISMTGDISMDNLTLESAFAGLHLVGKAENGYENIPEYYQDTEKAVRTPDASLFLLTG